jgi:dTMP kinase
LRGKLITIEGIEGAGKSTVLPFVRRYLEAAGVRVALTREPGGTPMGEEIRALLLSHRSAPVDPDTELLLMFAARSAHLHDLILPTLAQGCWVVSDRFTDATYAYQGGGRGVPLARVAAIETWVQGDFRPDLTLLLDVPPPLGLERARHRGGADRFELEEVAFFERARETYLARARAHPERYRVIDALPPPEVVRARVEEALESLIHGQAASLP